LPLGGLLLSMPPLRAYAIDIAGSMAGIAAFTGLSALSLGPLAWFSVVALLISLQALGTGLRRWSGVSALFMAGALALSVGQAARGDVWSPYYRVSTAPVQDLVIVNVDGIPHQAIQPIDYPNKSEFYEQVYEWFPDRSFDRVLVVGAGSGTDVGISLARGAGEVDAVEIDPYLQRLGVERHPNQPYADPRVKAFVNDGRAFLRGTDREYDLVVFALPDSLTLVSTSANLRLESFLFTTGAFASVREHLADDGLFVLYNYYRQPWLIEKITAMLSDSFGYAPIVRTYPQGGLGAAAIATGPAVQALGGGAPPGGEVDTVGPYAASLATDDWPFLYLQERTIPAHYLIALALLLAWAVVAVARGAAVSGTSFRRFSPHFFILGVAFLLLETRSLVTFSLLFGSTWIVNALVFFAILASVLLAIAINVRFPVRDPRLLYAGLFGSLAIAFLVPPESLLIEPAWLRYVIAAALAFAPVFFANLVFTYSFRETRTADMAFASNLLGAMVGGAIEYVALVSGYRALVIVVVVLYLAAYVLGTRFRVLADQDLVREPVSAFGSP
jgi:hypothetical protein